MTQGDVTSAAFRWSPCIALQGVAILEHYVCGGYRPFGGGGRLAPTNATPRLWAGCWTLFLGLNLAIDRRSLAKGRRNGPADLMFAMWGSGLIGERDDLVCAPQYCGPRPRCPAFFVSSPKLSGVGQGARIARGAGHSLTLRSLYVLAWHRPVASGSPSLPAFYQNFHARRRLPVGWLRWGADVRGIRSGAGRAHYAGAGRGDNRRAGAA